MATRSVATTRATSRNTAAFHALQVGQAPPLNSRCLDISVYLQHPHILAPFDSGEADSFLCYGER